MGSAPCESRGLNSIESIPELTKLIVNPIRTLTSQR